MNIITIITTMMDGDDNRDDGDDNRDDVNDHNYDDDDEGELDGLASAGRRLGLE